MQHTDLHFCNGTGISIAANSFTMADYDRDDDRELIRALSKWAGKSPSDLAKSAGLTPSTLTRPLNQTVKHRLSIPTLTKLRMRYPAFPGFSHAPDLPPPPLAIDYVPVDVLPTYAGMGGGGTGEGDVEQALVPQYLVRDVFRGQPSDFVVIRVRGNSMEPRFFQDDELLVDKRDTSPTQPGPFALWDADWGEYLVKNVERLPGGRVRIFPSNPEFSASEVSSEETKILGRPVWVGRRL